MLLWEPASARSVHCFHHSTPREGPRVCVPHRQVTRCSRCRRQRGLASVSSVHWGAGRDSRTGRRRADWHSGPSSTEHYHIINMWLTRPFFSSFFCQTCFDPREGLTSETRLNRLSVPTDNRISEIKMSLLGWNHFKRPERENYFNRIQGMKLLSINICCRTMEKTTTIQVFKNNLIDSDFQQLEIALLVGFNISRRTDPAALLLCESFTWLFPSMAVVMSPLKKTC